MGAQQPVTIIQPWICAPGTHYSWVDRCSVEYEVGWHLHMASTGNRTPDFWSWVQCPIHLVTCSHIITFPGIHAWTDLDMLSASEENGTHCLLTCRQLEPLRHHQVPITAGGAWVKHLHATIANSLNQIARQTRICTRKGYNWEKGGGGNLKEPDSIELWICILPAQTSLHAVFSGLCR